MCFTHIMVTHSLMLVCHVTNGIPLSLDYTRTRGRGIRFNFVFQPLYSFPRFNVPVAVSLSRVDSIA